MRGTVSTYVTSLLCALLLPAMVYSSRQWKSAAALSGIDGHNSVLVKTTVENNGSITVSYRVPPPEFISVPYQTKNGRSTKRCIVGNCVQNPIEGKPVLPFVPSRIVLPFGR